MDNRENIANDERRTLKNDPNKYEDNQKVIKREICKAKEMWIKNQCVEIEILEKKYDNSNLLKKSKNSSRDVKVKYDGEITWWKLQNHRRHRRKNEYLEKLLWTPLWRYK